MSNENIKDVVVSSFDKIIDAKMEKMKLCVSLFNQEVYTCKPTEVKNQNMIEAWIVNLTSKEDGQTIKLFKLQDGSFAIGVEKLLIPVPERNVKFVYC